MFVGTKVLSKTSEFPINVLEILFYFENAIFFGYGTQTKRGNSVVKTCFGSIVKSVAIPKMKLDFQNIYYWEFRSLGN